MTTTTLAEKLAAFADATKRHDIYDPAYDGGSWMVEAVETHETLEQFQHSSNGWIECSKDVRGEVAGLPFIGWSKMQAHKGMPRRSLSVIDFGDIRYAIDFDPTDL